MKKMIKKLFIPLTIAVSTFVVSLLPMIRNRAIVNDENVVSVVDDGNSREGIYILSVRKTPSSK